jgi:SAM-dependent methyltransferase
VDADEYRRMAAAGASHWWYRSTRRLLAQMLGPRLAGRRGARPVVLDAGGGSGATGSWMTAMADVVLADMEPMALAAARAEHPSVRTVVADLNRLPYADGAFDAVLCVTVLYHRLVPDPAAVVRDFARVVRPGGVVCLMEPGGRRLRRGHDAVTHTARRFSRSDLRRMCTDAGLVVERCTGAYTFLLPPAALLGLVERLRSGRATGSPQSDVDRSPSGLGGALGRLADAERAALRRVDLPGGLSVVAIARRPD